MLVSFASCNLPVANTNAAQFMYRRDQREDPSLSSYFDDSEKATATTPVSPLATTTVVAAQSRPEQSPRPVTGESVEGKDSFSFVLLDHYLITRNVTSLADSGPHIIGMV